MELKSCKDITTDNIWLKVRTQRYTLLTAFITAGCLSFSIFFSCNSAMERPLSTFLIFRTTRTEHPGSQCPIANYDFIIGGIDFRRLEHCSLGICVFCNGILRIYISGIESRDQYCWCSGSAYKSQGELQIRKGWI